MANDIILSIDKIQILPISYHNILKFKISILYQNTRYIELIGEKQKKWLEY